MTLTFGRRARRVVLVILGAALLGAAPAAAEAERGPVVTVTPAQFLGLPEPMQAAYVGGVLDGMTFTTWGYRIEDHDAFVECVSAIPVDDFTKRVIKWVAMNGVGLEVTATAVARVAGAQCRKPGPKRQP